MGVAYLGEFGAQSGEIRRESVFMPADLDAFDRDILKVVQGDNLLTHAQIGERVNLSPSSVRRRLTHMREQGVIAADVSIVDPTALGIFDHGHRQRDVRARETRGL